TVVYYTKAYITEKKTKSLNPRTTWYARHHRRVIINQVLFTFLVLLYLGNLAYEHLGFLMNMSITHWALLLVFPFAGALYYGINHPLVARYKLRNVGWLKDFIIGFVWAG